MCAKFVPKILSDAQKNERFADDNRHFKKHGARPNFPFKVEIGGDIWYTGVRPKNGTLRNQLFSVEKVRVKTMLLVFLPLWFIRQIYAKCSVDCQNESTLSDQMSTCHRAMFVLKRLARTDIVPTDFFLSPRMKMAVKGQRLNSKEKVQVTVTRAIASIDHIIHINLQMVSVQKVHFPGR